MKFLNTQFSPSSCYFLSLSYTGQHSIQKSHNHGTNGIWTLNTSVGAVLKVLRSFKRTYFIILIIYTAVQQYICTTIRILVPRIRQEEQK